MRILILDNFFNYSQFFKIKKNTNDFLKRFYNFKLFGLINKLKRRFENSEIKIITSNDRIDYNITNIEKFQLLSDFLVKIERSKYIELSDKIINNTREILKKFLNFSKKSKILHIKQIPIINITEAYIAMFLKEVFGEIELVKLILTQEKYDRIILFNVNPYFKTLFRKLNLKDKRIEICKSPFLFFIRRITILLRFKLLLPLTKSTFIPFLINKYRRNYIQEKIKSKFSGKINITFLANTLNQFKTIEQLYKSFEKQKGYKAFLYSDNHLLTSLKKIPELFRLILQLKRIWLKDFSKLSEQLYYDKISLQFIMKEFYKTHFFHFAINLYNNLLNFEDYIEEYKPVIMTMSNDLAKEDRLYAYHCKLKNIPTVYIPHADIPVWEEIVTKPEFDYIAAPGEIGKKYLIEKGVKDAKIIITGRPRYDPFYEGKLKSLTEIKDMFSEKTYRFNSNKFTVLMATNPVGEKTVEKNLFAVINSLKELNLLNNLIIKLHPREDVQFYKNYIKNLEIKPIIVKDINIFELIQSSSLLLAGISNTILESMIIGTPVICLDFVNIPFQSNGRYLFTDEKYIMIVKDQKKLTDKLNYLIKNKQNYEVYSNKLKKLSVKFSFSNGKMTISEIIINQFLNIIKKT